MWLGVIKFLCIEFGDVNVFIVWYLFVVDIFVDVLCFVFCLNDIIDVKIDNFLVIINNLIFVR